MAHHGPHHDVRVGVTMDVADTAADDKVEMYFEPSESEWRNIIERLCPRSFCCRHQRIYLCTGQGDIVHPNIVYE